MICCLYVVDSAPECWIATQQWLSVLSALPSKWRRGSKVIISNQMPRNSASYFILKQLLDRFTANTWNASLQENSNSKLQHLRSIITEHNEWWKSWNALPQLTRNFKANNVWSWFNVLAHKENDTFLCIALTHALFLSLPVVTVARQWMEEVLRSV